MDAGELICHWRFRAHRVQLAHYDAGRLYARLHLCFGIPAICLARFVGASVFATLERLGSTFQIVLGFFSVSSAVLGSLQTFFGNEELAERHRTAGAKYASLKHKLELIATMPPDDPTELRQAFVAIEEQWSTLREESPNIPGGIWRRIEKNITLEGHARRFPNLAKKFQRQDVSIEGQQEQPAPTF